MHITYTPRVIRTGLLPLLLLAAMVGAADPVATVSAHRDPIQGRTVYGFAIQLSSVPADAVTVTIAVTGTAVAGTDIESLGTSVVLPAGMPTTSAIFVPVTTLDAATVGRTVRCQLVAGTGYGVSGSGSTITIRKAVSADDFRILGEPTTLAPTAGSAWSYSVSVGRPSYITVGAFSAAVAAAPGFSGTVPTFTVGSASVADQTAPARIPVSFTASGAGQQLRVRITVTVDLDGLPETLSSGDVNEYNEDLTVTQDLVLAVRSGGSG